jgi:hypothetical protein
MSDEDRGDLGNGGEDSARGKGLSRHWEKAKQEVTPKINEYKYTDIDYDNDIRILKILSGSKDGTLRCMLFPSALPSSKSRSKYQSYPYIALSYFWGIDDPIHPVEMFDDTGVRESTAAGQLPTGRKFYIRKNLDAALRQFKHPRRDICVWVDALCINQSDVIEKKAQVSRMHEVYSEAQEVVVWLGEGNEETRKTFELLRSILNLEKLDKLIKEKIKPEQWMLIVKLMKLSWFSRRWVIQELALARQATVRWGDHSLPWEQFADAIALFMTRHDEIKAFLQKPKKFSDKKDPNAHLGLMEPRALGANTLVDATTNLFRRSDDGGRIQHRLVNLEVLVSSMFLAFEASEPRDTIYAVLSLAKDTMPRPKSKGRAPWMEDTKHHAVVKFIKAAFGGVVFIYKYFNSVSLAPEVSGPPDPYSVYLDDRIAPDYEKSLMDVCADFMEYCVETSKSLDILCRHWAPMQKRLTKRQKLQLKIEGREEEKEHMPTWIPSIEGHVYGEPLGVFEGRKNADSLVGGVERQYQQHYRASKDLQPEVTFRKSKEKMTDNGNEVMEDHPSSQNSEVDEGEPTDSATRAEMLPRPRLNKFDGTLHVKGFKLDTIVRLSGRVLNGVIPHEAFEYAGWPKKSKDSTYPEDAPERLWRTLVADRGPDGTNAPTWYRRACRECLNHTNTNGDLNTNEFKDLGLDDTPRTMKLFLERVRGVVWCRKFFLTGITSTEKRGKHYGLAPSGARENDIICILFGCSVPVVLRESMGQPGGPVLYEFIGECYVHGQMDGEFLSLHPDIPPHPYKGVQGFTLI